MTPPSARTGSTSDYVFPSIGLTALVFGGFYLAGMLVLATIAGIAGGETSNATYAASSDRYGWAAVIGAVVIWATGAALSAVRIRSRSKVFSLTMLILNVVALLFVIAITTLLQVSGSL